MSPELALAPDPEANELYFDAKGADLSVEARLITITTPEQYVGAGEFLKAVKSLRKEIVDFFAPLKSSAAASHKKLCEAETLKLTPLKDAERYVGNLLIAWDNEQQKKAEEETAKLQAQVRTDREASVMKEAERLEALGETDRAMELLDRPVLVPVVSVAPQLPKLSGLSKRETWKANVTDFGALVKHVAAHPDLLNLLLPNQVSLNAMARASRELLRLPGVEAVPETTMGGRSK